MENLPSRAIRNLTVAIGMVTLVGFIAIALFFSVGGFWGPLNDLSIALEALLSAALAWMLNPMFRPQSPKLSQAMLAVAIVGGLVTSIGSAFVIFKVTGYFLAGLFMGLGFALLGAWLYSFNRLARLSDLLPRGLTLLGQIAGGIMALGFLNIPGILNRIDSPADASLMENIAQVSALGWLILLPIWSIWLGRVLFAKGETA
ncbi:MAG: hypothetical protein FJZ87_05765 [Chloroflexi bacterium]|nr:hypothetical protein [Chloroflexota bacterium]